jgi:hypothetical protein
MCRPKSGLGEADKCIRKKQRLLERFTAAEIRSKIRHATPTITESNRPVRGKKASSFPLPNKESGSRLVSSSAQCANLAAAKTGRERISDQFKSPCFAEDPHWPDQANGPTYPWPDPSNDAQSLDSSPAPADVGKFDFLIAAAPAMPVRNAFQPVSAATSPTGRQPSAARLRRQPGSASRLPRLRALRAAAAAAAAASPKTPARHESHLSQFAFDTAFPTPPHPTCDPPPPPPRVSAYFRESGEVPVSMIETSTRSTCRTQFHCLQGLIELSALIPPRSLRTFSLFIQNLRLYQPASRIPPHPRLFLRSEQRAVP